MSYTSGRLFAGEKTGITGTAVQLATDQSNCREVLVQNDPDNAGNLLVGNSTAQEVTLTPGQSITIPIISLSLIWVKMSTGTGTANWLARD